MANENHILEILEYPEQEFAEHLSLEYNHRILFSGRFGIGKTTFLNYFFFKGGKYAEEYNAVHLFPVNYQVSDNRDIFEYIKYDIIAHLLSVEIKLVKDDIPATLTVPYLLTQRPADMLAPLLHFFGGAGKAYEKYQELVNEIYEQHAAVQKDEKRELLSFIEKVNQQPGSIYEKDFYTELIINLLQRWKGGGSEEGTKKEEENKKESKQEEIKREKKNVLIVDDLDRIDPQHAFRLFNIFAAHFDPQDGQENKFGFDKVVFVCDAQNIRNIFAHNYGSEVDFSGYIDKFFSTRVYRFDNAEAVRNIVKSAIHSSNFTTSLPQDKVKDRVIQYLEFVVTIFVGSGLINLRALFKMSTNDKMTHRNKMLKIAGTTFKSENFVIVVVLDFLMQIMGSPSALLEALKRSEGKTKEYPNLVLNNSMHWLLSEVIAFLEYKLNSSDLHEYSISEENITISYRMQDNHTSNLISIDIEKKVDEQGEIIKDEHRPDIFVMYQKALQKMIANSY